MPAEHAHPWFTEDEGPLRTPDHPLVSALGPSWWDCHTGYVWIFIGVLRFCGKASRLLLLMLC